MQLLSRINSEQNKLIILVSHNINLASEYCHRIVMLKHGQVIADGSPADVIDQKTIYDLYEVELTIINNPVSGQPNLIYPGKDAQ
jgi:iron complex transport system ATP-binding protein